MDIKTYLEESPIKMKSMLNEISNSYSKLAKVFKEEKFDKILITGSGTSYHGGVGTREFIENICGVKVDVLYPFLVTKGVFCNGVKTLVIAISQGGGSLSTYNALKIAKEAGCYIVTMTAKEGSHVDSMADFVLPIPCGEENVGAKTKGYYCTELNIIIMGLCIAKDTGKINDDEYNRYLERINRTIDNMQNIIDKSDAWIRNNMGELVQANDIRVVGTRDVYGSVLETALKLLETLRCPVTGYEFEEFIHGVYNAVNSYSYIFILNTGEDRERVNKLESILKEWTEHVFVIGKDVDENSKNLKLNMINDLYFRIFEYPIPLQLMCHYVPVKKGINPCIPKDPNFHRRMNSKAF